MVKFWLTGFIFYILGIISVTVRLKMEVQENPSFITDFVDKYLEKNENSLGNGAPYFCAIVPLLNLIMGIMLIIVTMEDKYWAKIKENMLDKN